MRFRTFWPAAIGVAVACQPAAAPLTAEDVSAIDALRDRFTQGAQAGDVAEVAALYTEDAIEMPPDAPALEGRAAIQGRLERVFPGITAFSLRGVETQGRDGLAYDRGTYSVSFQVEGQPQPGTDTGKFITILTKQADGSWLIHRLIWNRDAPAPMP